MSGEELKNMLRDVMDEKLTTTNANIAAAQKTVTEMNDAMKLIQKDIDAMKTKIDALETKLRSVTTIADEGLDMAKKLWKMHEAMEKRMQDQENGLGRNNSTRQNNDETKPHYAKFAQTKLQERLQRNHSRPVDQRTHTR